MIPCCCGTPSGSQNCVGVDSSILVDGFSDSSWARPWVPANHPVLTAVQERQRVESGFLKWGYAHPPGSARQASGLINWCASTVDWAVDEWIELSVDRSALTHGGPFTSFDEISFGDARYIWSPITGPTNATLTQAYLITGGNSYSNFGSTFEQSRTVRMRFTKTLTGYRFDCWINAALVVSVDASDHSSGFTDPDEISILIRSFRQEDDVDYSSGYYFDNLRIERSW